MENSSTENYLFDHKKSLSIAEHEKFLKLARKLSASYFVISTDPLIIHGVHNRSTKSGFLDSYRFIFDRIKDKTAYFLAVWHWHTEESKHAEFVREIEAEVLRQYPNLKFTHLCNTLQQVETFRQNDLEAIFCNQNCFLDERIFKPLPEVEKKYNAVYDARLIEFKRHFLAATVENLALIYAQTYSSEFNADYIIKAKQLLSNAHYFNSLKSGKFQHLKMEDINRSLNECRIGLCLSAVEGAMYASAQYLLAGLPIVTTPSLGGRDVFFDDRYTAIVEPDPAAVKKGVEDLINRNISPEFIRQKTLEKMNEHRGRFIKLVQDIYDKEGVKREFQSEWDKIFFNKMLRPQSHLETIKLIS